MKTASIITAVVLATLTSTAKADLLTGSIRVYPVSEVNFAEQIVEFYNGYTALPATVSGSFLALGPTVCNGEYCGPNVYFHGQSGDIPWTALGPSLYTIYGNGLKASLTITGPLSFTYAAPNGTPTEGVYASASMVMTGFDPTPGQMTMFMQTGDFPGYCCWTSIDFFPDQPSMVAVPAPIVGTGLPGLLLAALGWVGLRRRRS